MRWFPLFAAFPVMMLFASARGADSASQGPTRPGLDLQIDIDTEPVWVQGDAVRLEQVLANLLTNAIKFTPAGGRIQVTLRGDGTHTLLTVEDAGLGISSELLPFASPDSSVTSSSTR